MSDTRAEITVREACRRRMALDGADAQALDGALTITERERDAAESEVARLRAKLAEVEREANVFARRWRESRPIIRCECGFEYAWPTIDAEEQVLRCRCGHLIRVRQALPPAAQGRPDPLICPACQCAWPGLMPGRDDTVTCICGRLLGCAMRGR